MLENPEVKAHLTSTTCGESCWEAREEVCHCSCGGRNHGILRGGAGRPKRTCKISGFWHELFEIGGSRECQKKLDELSQETGEILYIGGKPGLSYYGAVAKHNQKIWPEVYGLNILMPYIIWKRIKSPLAALSEGK